MTVYTLLTFAPMLALLVVAACIDVRSRRIPNWLCLIMILTGLMRSFFAVSHITPLQSLAGFGIGFGLGFLLFAAAALGGGDVKLLAGVGMWVGIKPIFCIFVLSAVVGMVLVVVIMTHRRRARELLGNTAVLAVEMFRQRRLDVSGTTATARSFKSIDQPLPFAVAVAIATVIFLMLQPSLRGMGI